MRILGSMKVGKDSAVLKRSKSIKRETFLKSSNRAMVCETPKTVEDDMA